MINEVVQKANDAVSEALATYEVSMRAFENAVIVKEQAYVHLTNSREDLEDVLRVQGGLQSKHNVYNEDRTEIVPRFLRTFSIDNSMKNG